jgi:hypothetical protein
LGLFHEETFHLGFHFGTANGPTAAERFIVEQLRVHRECKCIPMAVRLSTIVSVISKFLTGAALFVTVAMAVHAQDSGRVFEMRTYTTLEGRLDALQKRFREHTVKLFEKHGMTNIGYWVPQDPARSKNTLVYILAHRSREAAEKSWAAFRADPEWVKARNASEADGKIVDKIEAVFMTATDYSALK